MQPADKAVTFPVQGEDKQYCQILDPLVPAGQRLSTRDVIRRTYNPAGDGFGYIKVRIYASSTLQLFPHCKGVLQRGEIKVEMPDLSGDRQRDVEVYVVFGGSEIQVFATDVTTRKEFRATIDWDSRSPTTRPRRRKARRRRLQAHRPL